MFAKPWLASVLPLSIVLSIVIGCSRSGSAPQPGPSSSAVLSRSEASSTATGSENQGAVAITTLDAGAGPACTPSAKTSCFRDAQLEDAAFLFAKSFKRPVVLLGTQRFRFSGAIEGASADAAFEGLVEVAQQRRVLVDHFQLSGASWLASWAVTREKPTPKSKSPAGCAGKIDATFFRTPVVRGLLQLTANLNHLETDPVGNVVEIGEMSVFGEQIDLCGLLTHAIELGGGTLKRVGRKLVVSGGRIASHDADTEAPQCGNQTLLSSLECFPIADLEVVAIAGEGEKRQALVRSRYGRTAFARSALVRVGNYLGVEQMKVVLIADDALIGDKDRKIALAPGGKS